jgi:hypothetical protein
LQGQSALHFSHLQSLPQHLPSELHLQSLHSHFEAQQQFFPCRQLSLLPANELTGAAIRVMAAIAIARDFNMARLL